MRWILIAMAVLVVAVGTSDVHRIVYVERMQPAGGVVVSDSVVLQTILLPGTSRGNSEDTQTPGIVLATAAGDGAVTVIEAPSPAANFTPSRATGEGQLSEAALRAGAEPEWVGPLVAIASCETGGTFALDAVGDGGQSLGVWQTWRGWYAAAGEDIAHWRDIDVAARVAVYVRRVRGRFGGAGGWACADILGII